MSDFFSELVCIQNKLLLQTIASYKFTEETEQREFIERYHKLNYHKVKVARDPQLYRSYKRRSHLLSNHH